jgi:leucine dehydrogenase
MNLFDTIAKLGHEQLVLCADESAGYRGIIAIHDTTLGPALGGTRFWNYGSDEEAITDALRLARGMTYKNAVAGLNLGGGKSVIIGDNRTTNREMIFRAHGRFVESLGGRYVTAEDVGTGTGDMDFVHMETEYVAGLANKSGDPSPVTARGVFRAILASAMHKWGSASLEGKTVTVQGLGNVGTYLCRELKAVGAKLIVTDIRPERVKAAVEEFGATAVQGDEIYSAKADIFAPLRARRDPQRRHHPQAQGRDRLRRRQQPAPRAREAWRGARQARHQLRPRLRRQCRRRDQRLRRGRRLDARARPPQGGRDLRHRPRRLQDRQG